MSDFLELPQTTTTQRRRLRPTFAACVATIATALLMGVVPLSHAFDPPASPTRQHAIKHA